MTKLLGTLMVLIAGAAPSVAFPVRQQVCHQPVVVQQVVKQVEIVTPVIQQVIVPVYGIVPYAYGYAAPAPVAVAPVVNPQEEILLKMVTLLSANLEETKSMRLEMRQALKGEALPEPKKQGAAPSPDFERVVGALRTNCAQCHNAASAAQDGGDLVLFKADGSFSPVTDDMGRRLVRKVSNGTMPPPPAKLPEADKALILSAFKK